jgi:hypothetical protein
MREPSRRIEMNVLKVTLVVVALLGIAILSGCQEGHSKENDLVNVNKVAFQHTGTGFWRPATD